MTETLSSSRHAKEQGAYLPLLYTRKEVFQWLLEGKKTIDIRKGNPLKGGMAVFQCGSNVLRLEILRIESGPLRDILRQDNFPKVIPSAFTCEEAVKYLQGIYEGCEGIFTAYYVAPLK